MKNIYACEACSAYFSEKGLNEHIKLVHKTSSIPCSTCNSEFTSIGAYTDHTCFKNKDKNVLKDEKSKIQDKSQEKNAQIAPVKKGNQSEKVFKCNFDKCTEKFQDFQLLKLHLLKVHKKDNFCSKCMIVFSNETELEDHFKFVHENMKEKRCPLCDKDFEEYPGLIIHLR